MRREIQTIFEQRDVSILTFHIMKLLMKAGWDASDPEFKQKMHNVMFECSPAFIREIRCFILLGATNLEDYERSVRYVKDEGISIDSPAPPPSSSSSSRSLVSSSSSSVSSSSSSRSLVSSSLPSQTIGVVRHNRVELLDIDLDSEPSLENVDSLQSRADVFSLSPSDLEPKTKRRKTDQDGSDGEGERRIERPKPTQRKPFRPSPVMSSDAVVDLT